MFEKQALSQLSEAEVLDAAGTCVETMRTAEVDQLRIAYQWAVLHPADRLDPVESARPGREGARRYGGPGTALVTEFAAAELGARMGLTTWSAAALMADALDLHHRHPRLWARVQAGEVRVSYARHVCQRTRELSAAEATWVDGEVVESADGRIPWTRFEALVAGKVVAAAPALARAKELRARRARFAKRIGSTEHGMASFLVRADVATIEAIDAAVTAGAERLARALPDDPDPESAAAEGVPAVADDDRRVLAILELARPGAVPGADLSSLQPQVSLVVHLDGRPPATDHPDHPGHPPRVARIEGHGPVSESWVREVLGPRCRFTIRPVLDPLGQVPVDAYEIPARHRRAVRLLTPADVFPFSSCTSDSMQVDHTTPFTGRPDSGPSAVGNYGPMTTLHHRIKTFGRWQVEQPFAGIFVWRDPHGAHYLVDHTGTRRVGPVAPTARPVVVELYRSAVRLDLDLAS